MTVIHLTCGAIGAGKTSYALELCDSLSAVHFWMDDWMRTLFGADLQNIGLAPYGLWAAERFARCELQMVKMAVDCGLRGIPSVLDMGLLQASHRRWIADHITAAGLGYRLHVLDASPEERWRRVIARNTQQGESYRVHVDRDLFDFVESLWEPPTPEEIENLNVIYIGAVPYANGQDTGHPSLVKGHSQDSADLLFTANSQSW
jgi:predicted kinase